MAWQSLTFDEFLRDRATLRQQKKTLALTEVEELNAAILGCKRATGLNRKAFERVVAIYAQLQCMAAQKGPMPQQPLHGLIDELMSLGVKVLRPSKLDSSDEAVGLHNAKDEYNDYLDSQQMFKREVALAERHAKSR